MLTTLACTRLGKMAGIPFNRESRLFTAEIQGASIGAFREWIQEYKVKDIAQWAEVEDSEEAARIYDASPYIGAAVYETKFTYFFEYAHGDSRLLRVTVSQTQPALLL